MYEPSKVMWAIFLSFTLYKIIQQQQRYMINYVNIATVTLMLGDLLFETIPGLGGGD